MSLTDRVTALERRLAAIERERTSSVAPAPAALGLLEQLARRTGARWSDAGDRAAIGYAGVANLGEREYRWAREHGLAELGAADWATAAPVFESLGSPPRLALLHALLRGPCSRQVLQDVLGDATSGQLYHHLRQLQNARLVVQPSRGNYELSATAVIPVLVVLAIALDLAGTTEPPRGSR